MQSIHAYISQMQNSIYSGEDPLTAITNCYHQLLPIHHRNHLNQSTLGGNWLLPIGDTVYLEQMISDMQAVMGASYNGNIPAYDSEYRRARIAYGNSLLALMD